MKNFCAVFALFCVMFLFAACGSDSKESVYNDTDTSDSTSDKTDSDASNTNSDDADSSDSADDSDNGDSAPDNGDTEPDNDSSDSTDDEDSSDSADDSDNGDSAPDNGDTEPDNDYPQTPCDPNPCISDANSTGACTTKDDGYVCGCKSGYIFDGTLCIKSLPECSPESATPCIDSTFGLIWSGKSENKMSWNDAVNYCQNLTEGSFNDWRLPSIAVLKTLVQNCSSAQCTDDFTGKYSKFADTVYLWSFSEGEDSTALTIYFSDASTQPVNIDTNINVRCVRREAESRQSNCTGLIENSVWNTATQITQTWDWETAGWTPSPEGSYNTNGSSSECRFKCDSSYFWNSSAKKCLNPCKPNPCTGPGETGICVGESANSYYCECKENYFWDWYYSSGCLNPCDPNPCTSIGETGVCLGTWAYDYTCECEDNYFWVVSSNECMKNPCLNNPCNIPNSTGTCKPVTETQYTCGCEENYFFDPNSGKCLNPCESNPCDYLAAITDAVCIAFTYDKYSCSGKDSASGLIWSARASYTMRNNSAKTYCNNLTEGGYSDWRLPNIDELKTLLTASRVTKNCSVSEVNNCLSSACWGCTTCTQTGSTNPPSYQCVGTESSAGRYSKFREADNFWSSSTRSDNTGNAWYVNFSYGNVGNNNKSNLYNVRCVR